MRRFSYIILGLAVLAGLFLIGWSLLQPKDATTNRVPEASNSGANQTACPAVERAEVKITSNGFEPSKVCVVEGGSVAWINTTTVRRRVASGPHPTHSDYPGFDDVAGEGANEIYVFTFAKAGTWGYHDHSDPALMGQVVVVAR